MANKTAAKKRPKAQIDPFMKAAKRMAEMPIPSSDAFLVVRHPNGSDFIVLHWSFKDGRVDSLSQSSVIKFAKGKVSGLGLLTKESARATRRRHEKTVDRVLGGKPKTAFEAGTKEALRQRGIPANADGKVNASFEELRFLGPKTVASLAKLMTRGIGVQIGKRGLKVTVLRLRETIGSKAPKPPAIVGMKHQSTMVSKDRFTHNYTKPGVKFGSF